MSEYVQVSGFGSSREQALADADRQAAAWFGSDTPTRRLVGGAHVTDQTVGGDFLFWKVDVRYERRPRGEH